MGDYVVKLCDLFSSDWAHHVKKSNWLQLTWYHQKEAQHRFPVSIPLALHIHIALFASSQRFLHLKNRPEAVLISRRRNGCNLLSPIKSPTSVSLTSLCYSRRSKVLYDFLLDRKWFRPLGGETDEIWHARAMDWPGFLFMRKTCFVLLAFACWSVDGQLFEAQFNCSDVVFISLFLKWRCS